MKKLYLLIAVALVLVAAMATISNAGPTPFCYGKLLIGDMPSHPPVSGATLTCVENGWTATSNSDGSFYLYPSTGIPQPGTYHIHVTKGQTIDVTFSFYYSSGANVGIFYVYP